ncbi:uncharacterized protein LACBIDRAFT_333995 [Laccaria bicolor S238N-H82]|uniref:Predicted protein n=1 Tax=Laccaria bicolor (strain S238N-H82 / ATCC MYA-4686) TaxID=486041 RepID=B0DXR7_LACBS|nr:uncharacterized protein LACBIDRAFT_333995 [Laccaria bicolor S238N-H82]EDR00661.1 predicted protein [Laccaria bicolor S238N-H82]|eukprot:XP_001888670.1 predicted protein [Laccaria bicolor S238N-H82]
MLVLQILTAALTISFAKANPLVVDVRNWENPTADGAFKRGELDVASPASNYAEYIPSPTETSLTYHYYQERACIAAVANLPSPVTLWSLVPCAIAALCGTVTVVLGALCCNGIIKNCATNIYSIAANNKPLTATVMAALNGGQGNKATFTRATVRSELDSYLKSKGSKTPSDKEFNGMYDKFLIRTFCSFGPGEEGPGCLQASVSYLAMVGVHFEDSWLTLWFAYFLLAIRRMYSNHISIIQLDLRSGQSAESVSSERSTYVFDENENRLEQSKQAEIARRQTSFAELASFSGRLGRGVGFESLAYEGQENAVESLQVGDDLEEFVGANP